MNKLLAASVTAMFAFGSTATLAEHPAQSEHVSARQILIEMACKDKKPGEEVMDPTDARKRAKCHEPRKGGRDLGSPPEGGY
ncbi:MAG: hypothetical protein AABY81_00605 [Pseudomonadota bacterium]